MSPCDSQNSFVLVGKAESYIPILSDFVWWRFWPGPFSAGANPDKKTADRVGLSGSFAEQSNSLRAKGWQFSAMPPCVWCATTSAACESLAGFGLGH
jgi:hypothetical protein